MNLFEYYLESTEKDYNISYFEKKFKVKTVKDRDNFILYPNLEIGAKNPSGFNKYTDCIQLKIESDKIMFIRANLYNYKKDEIKEFINSLNKENKFNNKFFQIDIIPNKSFLISDKNIKKLISLAVKSKEEYNKKK